MTQGRPAEALNSSAMQKRRSELDNMASSKPPAHHTMIRDRPLPWDSHLRPARCAQVVTDTKRTLFVQAMATACSLSTALEVAGLTAESHTRAARARLQSPIGARPG